jgi:protein-S-isoprenylcysteine O-methyltransferase Ste14
MHPWKLTLRLIVQAGLWLGIMAVLLFGAAGNWRWPQGWAFLAIFAAGSAVLCIWLLKRDPALLAERLKPVVQKDQPLWDRVFIIGIVIFWCAWFFLMGLDAGRWHTVAVPVWLEIVGGGMIVAGFLAIMPVFTANSFAAPVVRIQSERKQRVIANGPYSIVRHPMYAVSMLYMFGIPLLLGSAYGLIGAALIMLAMARRAVLEERTLRHELDGYADYMTRVRYRLVPRVW